MSDSPSVTNVLKWIYKNGNRQVYSKADQQKDKKAITQDLARL